MDAYNHGNPGSVREQRLNYFMENYLPKNEVLYRLPLDIQIEPFWAELQNRRKAGAVLLPLENAAGMPYWYTLTKKMVAASTRLCGEALSCTEALDPFRMKMTSAMTQEMYFTSFVEGAQISLEDSLDFLGSGAEPSNIGEQMVWNNRQAWTQMCQNLYRPMDEDYLKYLAWCLTDGMENCADDYRQTDTHPIAAMGHESYSVPPAYRIPDMMRRYAAFLMDPGIHPLVKASAGAAYLLVTRPFPEGNERLSRMVPAAVLFRSGYPFFKDISLSGVIAKENYLYYKGMCDIIRDGGDLTYFMEYFLEMLVRALEQMNDRKRKKREEEEKELEKKEKDLAEKEHQLAVVPLGESNGIPPDGNTPEGGYHTEDAPGTAEIQGSIQAGIITGTTDESNGIPGDPAESLVILSPEAFQHKIEALGKSGKKIVQTRAVEAVKWFLSNGVTEITQAAISSHFGYSQWQSRDILHELKNEGLIVPLKHSERGTYSYSLAQGAEACRGVWEPEADAGMGGKKTESTDPDDVNNTPFQRYLDHREKYAADHSVLSEDCHYMSEWIASDETSGMADDMKAVLTGLLNEELIGSIRGAIFISYCLEKGKTQFLGKDYDEFSGAYTDDDVIRFVEKIVVGADKVSVVFKAGISVDVMR